MLSINRRDSITLAGLSLSGVASNSFSCLAEQSKTSGESVIVVGAGMAGIAASKELAESGYEVVILEARDRIGGRIWTSDQWNELPLDLGASWIHGTNGNPLVELAKIVQARTASTDEYVVYSPDGKRLKKSVRDRIEQLTKTLNKGIRRAQNADHDQSIHATVQAMFDGVQFTREDEKLVNFILNNTIEQEYAGSVTETSTWWYDDDSSFGNNDVYVLSGYKAIADHLLQSNRVLLRQTVEKIDWNAAGVTVTTNQGLHRADRVVVTLPLGVLKTKKIQFSPGLPNEKQRAIDALGMGVLNKCC